MGAQHRHPVGDGLETFSAIPAVPSELRLSAFLFIDLYMYKSRGIAIYFIVKALRFSS